MGKHEKHRALVKLNIGAIALASALTAATAQATPCRQALAMGLDVSGSVDAGEYRLQLDGLAAALNDPMVRDTLLSMQNAPVRLSIYEWSTPTDQRLIIGWTEITSPAAIDAIVNRLHATTRAPMGPSTAIGVGLTYGAQLLNTQNACWKRTLDISGDGRSNTGPRPQDVTGLPVLEGINVNALVIGNGGDVPGSLETYFKSLVIHGPDAFTQVADGFTAYEDAMIQKLLRELQGFVVSELHLPAGR